MWKRILKSCTIYVSRSDDEKSILREISQSYLYKAAFASAYPDAGFKIIHPDNVEDFLLGNT